MRLIIIKYWLVAGVMSYVKSPLSTNKNSEVLSVPELSVTVKVGVEEGCRSLLNKLWNLKPSTITSDGAVFSEWLYVQLAILPAWLLPPMSEFNWDIKPDVDVSQ